jgi:hypothetical protein
MVRTLEKIAEMHLGLPSSMLHYSKGEYRYNHLRHLIVFNSSVYVELEGTATRIWKGDIDLTLSFAKVENLAEELGMLVYVVYEGWDGVVKLDEAAMCTRGVGGSIYANSNYVEVTDNGVPLHKVVEPVEKAPAVYPAEEYIKVPLVDEDYDYLSITDMFDGVTVDTTPLNNYYRLVCSKFAITAEEALRVYMTFEDYQELERLMGLWIDAYYPYFTPYRRQKELHWMLFMSGPNNFETTPEWAEDGCLYKKKETK